MPGVLGCIDCSHIAIIRPTENEERYYCRKQYHSLNIQLVRFSIPTYLVVAVGRKFKIKIGHKNRNSK